MREIEAQPIPVERAIRDTRRAIVALLKRDPHCPVAQLLGQALMDLYEERAAGRA